MLDIMDGKLEPDGVLIRTTPGHVAGVCGLSASQMAVRLGLDVGAYLEREAVLVRLEGKVYRPSPEELLRQLVEAERRGA